MRGCRRSTREGGSMRGSNRWARASLRRRVAAVTLALLVADGVAAFHLLAAVHPVTVRTAVVRYRRMEANAPKPAIGHPDIVTAASVPVTKVVTATAGHPSAARAAKTGPATPERATATPVEAPLAGVYSYATTGGEHITSLGGLSHSYPSTTAITITPTGCGDEVRWQPLDARYDDYQFFTDGRGVAIASFVTYHQFDRQVDKKTYTCAP